MQEVKRKIPIIAMEHISKQYSTGVDALQDISLRIEKGEFVFIVGKSGSGKSTFIKLLLKELDPTEGRLFVGGRQVTRLKRKQVSPYRRQIGVVFQDFRLLKNKTVYENIAFAQQIIGVSRRETERNAAIVLDMVGLTGKEGTYPQELSGGEQQRVAIARAIAHKPRIIFADEPTAELDTATGLQVMKIFRELIQKEEVTIVMTTHDMGLLEIADCIYHLEDGEIINEK